MTIISNVSKNIMKAPFQGIVNTKRILIIIANVSSKGLAYILAFFGTSGIDRQGNVFTKRPTY